MLGRNQTCNMTTMERFESFVVPEPNSGCWLWLGAVSGSSKNKYAQFWSGEKVVHGHRWIYEKLYGIIGPGLEIDHKCRITCCVNPDHLRAITHRENVLCGTAFSAIQHRQTHCIHGHEFNSNNTYIGPNGKRVCKPCRRIIDNRRQPRAIAP